MRSSTEATVKEGLVRHTMARNGRRFFSAPTRSLNERGAAAAWPVLAAIRLACGGRGLVSSRLYVVARHPICHCARPHVTRRKSGADLCYGCGTGSISVGADDMGAGVKFSLKHWRRAAIFQRLGPGVITGAADDDPSGIATYSQAGAQFGFNMLWITVLTFPLMSAVQMISARIGRVTGHGLAANMNRVFPRWMVSGLVGLLFVANTINIGADLAAMGAAAQLTLGWGEHLFTILFTVISLVLQIWVPYHRYVRFLKWLTLALFAYVGVVFTVRIDWGQVLLSTVLPDFALTAAAVTLVVAV